MPNSQDKRWFQFSLRALFVVTLSVSLLTAWKGKQIYYVAVDWLSARQEETPKIVRHNYSPIPVGHDLKDVKRIAPYCVKRKK